MKRKPAGRTHFTSSAELRAHLRDLSPDGKIVLAFSRGKDAIAAWLALRDSFEVVPYYCDPIPGLAFIEESVAYYERVFATKIHRFPHPSLYRQLRNLVFQPPERWTAIVAADLPRVKGSNPFADVDRRTRELCGSPQAFVATGVRAADSLNRRLSILHRGPVRWSDRTAMVVYDWTLGDIETAMRRADVRLPIDYEWFGRSFDGIDHMFVEPLRRHAPEDYRRVLERFPLCDLEMFRREMANGA